MSAFTTGEKCCVLPFHAFVRQNATLKPTTNSFSFELKIFTYSQGWLRQPTYFTIFHKNKESKNMFDYDIVDSGSNPTLPLQQKLGEGES